MLVGNGRPPCAHRLRSHSAPCGGGFEGPPRYRERRAGHWPVCWSALGYTGLPVGVGEVAVLGVVRVDAFDAAEIYLWRVNNLLLAAVAVDVVSVEAHVSDRLHQIANGMDTRAH